MKRIYKDIWKLARPYYEKGRFMDIPHIEWIMEEADRIANIENLNKDLLMPIVILHDVGYSALSDKKYHFKDKKAKIAHMKKGAKIAEKILGEINYDKELALRIARYVSIHDNWILGDDKPFKECREMGVFNDLDFIFPLKDSHHFRSVGKSNGIKLDKLYDMYANDEKLARRPFCTGETAKMYKRFMDDRKQEIKEYERS